MIWGVLYENLSVIFNARIYFGFLEIFLSTMIDAEYCVIFSRYRGGLPLRILAGVDSC